MFIVAISARSPCNGVVGNASAARESAQHDLRGIMPGYAITPPPGCTDAPHWYKPATGVS